MSDTRSKLAIGIVAVVTAIFTSCAGSLNSESSPTKDVAVHSTDPYSAAAMAKRCSTTEESINTIVDRYVKDINERANEQLTNTDEFLHQTLVVLAAKPYPSGCLSFQALADEAKARYKLPSDYKVTRSTDPYTPTDMSKRCGTAETEVTSIADKYVSEINSKAKTNDDRIDRDAFLRATLLTLADKPYGTRCSGFAALAKETRSAVYSQPVPSARQPPEASVSRSSTDIGSQPTVSSCDGPKALKADGSVGPLCLEEQMIFADTEGHLPDHLLEVNRARFLIDYLEAHTVSSRKEIADKAFRTSEMIKKQIGLPYTGLRALEDARSIIESTPAGKKSDINSIMFLVYGIAGKR